MTLRLNGDTSGFTEIKAADAAGDNSIKLPAANGGANQLLQNGGTAGELQYTSAGGGLHYDSSGRLLINHTADVAPDGYASTLQLCDTSYQGSSLVVRRDGTNGSGPTLLLAKSRSSSKGGNGIVSNGDDCGTIRFYGNDGVDISNEVARIRSEVDGTPGTDVMPGKLVFSTNAGGASVTPRVEIASDGALKLLAGCPGIDFSAMQTETTQTGADHTSTLLDHYEEGYWSPIMGSTSGADFTQGTANYGYYTRIGDLVFATATMEWNGGGNITGMVMIKGFPFAASSRTAYRTSQAINNTSSGPYASGVYDSVSHGFDANNTFTWLTMHYGTTSSGANYSHSPNVPSAGIIFGLNVVYQAVT